MTQPRVTGSAHARRWPPDETDRRDNAVEEVCGYLTRGELNPAQVLALALSVRTAEMKELMKRMFG